MSEQSTRAAVGEVGRAERQVALEILWELALSDCRDLGRHDVAAGRTAKECRYCGGRVGPPADDAADKSWVIEHEEDCRWLRAREAFGLNPAILGWAGRRGPDPDEVYARWFGHAPDSE